MDILKSFVARDIELIPDGELLRVRGDLTDEDRAFIRSNKPQIMEALKTNCCLGCKAAGYWDFADYAGKMLCFHYAVYECRSGKPTPCHEAIKTCPKMRKR